MKPRICLPKTIQELQALGKEKIMEMWLRYFEERPTVAVRNMERALWYKIQCEQFKLRIEQKHITRLNRYSAAPDKFIEKSHKTKYHLKSGTEIVKIYKGLFLVLEGVEFKFQAFLGGFADVDGAVYSLHISSPTPSISLSLDAILLFSTMLF